MTCTATEISKILTNCGDELTALRDLFTVFGLFGAGFYGYQRFIHGRLFTERLTPKIDLECYRSQFGVWVVAKCRLTNPGERRLSFKERSCHVTLFGQKGRPERENEASSDLSTEFDFAQISVRTVFDRLSVIESGEEVEDSTEFYITGLEIDILRAELRISEERDYEVRTLRSGASWSVDGYVNYPDSQLKEKQNAIRKKYLARSPKR